MLSQRTYTALCAFIDGPYSALYNFGEYRTVIMFTSGIRITGHMLYIKDLILAYNNCEAQTRHVFLVWQVEDERE